MKDRIVKSNTCQNLVVGYSLIDVAYIPPHVDDLLILLDDYKMFVHNDKINIPHLVRCAVAHYQFETLHPFQEVNGLMKTGEMGIIETKGKETEQDRVKKRFLQEWIDAVNQHGGFGKWAITKSKFSTRE